MKRLTRRSLTAFNFPEDEKRNTFPTTSFNTKFSLPSFTKRVDKLTEDQRTAISRTGFGHLLKIHDQLLSRSLLTELMDRWDCEKLAFMLPPGEITITPRDVAMILGLRVIGKPVSLSEDEPISDTEQEYGATASNRKIDISSIEEKLESLGEVADEDFVRSFLLFTFGVFLFPSATEKVVDSRYLSFLRDLDKVHEFAWGEAVLQHLVKWLSKRKTDKVQCAGGCLLLLQVWFYEHIDIGRPNLLDSVTFPRSHCWASNRPHQKRQWYCNKLDELEENQVTWILQPSIEEAKVDIFLKELLEVESSRLDHLTEEPSPSRSLFIEEHLHPESPTQDNLTEEPSPSSSILMKVVKDSFDICSPSLVEVEDSVFTSHTSINDHLLELEIASDEEVKDSLDTSRPSLAEVPDSLDSYPTINDHLDKLKIASDQEVESAVNHLQEHDSGAAEASPHCQNEYSKDLLYSKRLEASGSLGEERIPMGKTTECKELHKLRTENGILKDQLQYLQEENAKLKEEIEELRRENDCGGLVDRLQSLVDEFPEGF